MATLLPAAFAERAVRGTSVRRLAGACPAKTQERSRSCRKYHVTRWRACGRRWGAGRAGDAGGVVRAAGAAGGGASPAAVRGRAGAVAVGGDDDSRADRGRDARVREGGAGAAGG